MTRINDVAKIMYDQMTQIGQQPTTNDIARALDDAGHLMPDLLEPEKIGESLYWGTIAEWHPDCGLGWCEDGLVSRTTPDQLREEAYALLAAADYAERNQK